MLAKVLQRTFKLAQVKLRPALFANQQNVVLFYGAHQSFATFITNKNKQEQSFDNPSEDLQNNDNEHQNWKADYEMALMMYPFHNLPIGVVRRPYDNDINQDLKRRMIAFRCIKARGNDLLMAYQYLFPDRSLQQPLQLNDNAGLTIFTIFFQDSISDMVQALNKQMVTIDKGITYLIIMSNIILRQSDIDNIKRIDEAAIVRQDASGALAAYYMKLLIKNNGQYTHFFSLLTQKLEDSNIEPENHLKIVRAIISTPNFWEYYPQRLLDLCLKALSNNLSTMHHNQILLLLRYIYPYNSSESKKLGMSIQNLICKRHLQQNNIDFRISLILKTIRYCAKQGVSTEPLVEFVMANISRFYILFMQNKYTKGVFYNLFFPKYSKKEISPELIRNLRDYLLDSAKSLATVDEIEEAEVIRFCKLVVKFFEFLIQSEKAYIRSQFINHILPNFDSSTQIIYFSLLIILRNKIMPINEFKVAQVTRDLQTTKKYIKIFLQKRCVRNNKGELLVDNHVTSVVQIMYQCYRQQIQLPKDFLPHICRYDFSQKQTITPECISYFFTYLSKNKHQKKSDINAALTSFEPTMETYLRNGKIYAIKTIFNIIDICNKANFQHNFFYKLLEGAIGDYLVKNPKYFINQNDLRFIRDRLLKRNYGSKGLGDLVYGTLKNPQEWESLRRQYIEKEKQFMEKLKSKKRQFRESKNDSDQTNNFKSNDRENGNAQISAQGGENRENRDGRNRREHSDYRQNRSYSGNKQGQSRGKRQNYGNRDSKGYNDKKTDNYSRSYNNNKIDNERKTYKDNGVDKRNNDNRDNRDNKSSIDNKGYNGNKGHNANQGYNGQKNQNNKRSYNDNRFQTNTRAYNQNRTNRDNNQPRDNRRTRQHQYSNESKTGDNSKYQKDSKYNKNT